MLTQNPDAPLVLIVEDDSDHAELILRSFDTAFEEYRIEMVGSLSAARAAIAQSHPALVLTDYRLPDGDGKELVPLADQRCPVVLMTSQGNEQLAVEAIKAGAQDYIVKSPESFLSMPRFAGLALREWAMISERLKSQEAVSRAKREWEQTFDAVSDLIAIIDTNHTILRVNRAMAERCGLTPEEMPDRKCYEVVHGLNAPPSFCPFVRMLQCGQEQNQEMEENHINGVFDVTVSPMFDCDGQRINAGVHVVRDISDKRKAEQESRNLEKKFQQTQKLESLGVLAGGIAHDFNNILTIILGHCTIFQNEIDASGDPHSHLQHIEIAANRAADLCRQMLAYAGKSPSALSSISICLQVDEIVKMLKSAIKKNVAIEFSCQGRGLDIAGDTSQIQQIIMNLIINAAEAIGDNSGTIRVTIEKVSIPPDNRETDYLGDRLPDGNYALLQVADDGCGMSAETQRRIFEPFYTTKFTGRGLGMSAVLGIVKSHGGSISLSSRPGAGSTFKVYFPLLNQLQPAVETLQTRSETLDFSGHKVLLVDDERELLNIVSMMMGGMGLAVMTASNGSQALDIYRSCRERISLIMLDLMMPDLGGLETYRELRKMSATIPVIMASGYDMESALQAIGDDPHVSAIKKPYRPEQLRSLLSTLLD